MYGAQFDCVQTGMILETVFKGAVAAADVPLQLGAPLLRNMLDRQHEQIAGIQAFISSLKVCTKAQELAGEANRSSTRTCVTFTPIP